MYQVTMSWIEMVVIYFDRKRDALAVSLFVVWGSIMLNIISEIFHILYDKK